MKRARDVRDQLVNLLARVEVDLVSNASENINIRKVRTLFSTLMFGDIEKYYINEVLFFL